MCINGRHWLSNQLDGAGIGYAKRDNCFVEIEDVEAAQGFLSEQLRTNWNKELNSIVLQVSPGHQQAFAGYPLKYYWSADETEWATDVMFRRPQHLASLYERLLHQGITTFGSREVMRFLGQKTPAQAGIHGNFTGEVVTDMKQRPEGIRLKHRLNRNSVKMYDKQGSVLRVETTINNTRDFKVYRRPENQPTAKLSWQKMRKGVSDLHRRAKVSQAVNERYLDALATVDDEQTLGDIFDTISKPKTWKKSRIRAINPSNKNDILLLEVIARGEFAISGLRNRDLRKLLLPAALNEDIKRKQSARISRELRLLRAHGLIAKIPSSYRYRITSKGLQLVTALNAYRKANTKQLLQLAA